MRKYSLLWALHPEKTRDWYEEQLKRRTPDAVARELDINYTASMEGKVFAAFQQDRHIVTDKMPYNPHLPVYRVWDFGKTNATLYIQKDSYNRKRVLHERVLGWESDTTSNTLDQIRAAQADSDEFFKGATFIDICDPAGSYSDHRGVTTDLDILFERMGVAPYYQTIMGLPTSERKKRGRELIKIDLQTTPSGQEGFKLYCDNNNSDGCPILKKAFLGGYCYRKDGFGNLTDRIKEAHPYEDVIDCLIYFYLEADSGVSIGPSTGNWEPVTDSGYDNIYLGFL